MARMGSRCLDQEVVQYYPHDVFAINGKRPFILVGCLARSDLPYDHSCLIGLDRQESFYFGIVAVLNPGSLVRLACDLHLRHRLCAGQATKTSLNSPSITITDTGGTEMGQEAGCTEPAQSQHSDSNTVLKYIP